VGRCREHGVNGDAQLEACLAKAGVKVDPAIVDKGEKQMKKIN
jgi:hypothetical protein